MKYDAIILAAGKGTRTKLEYNKVFYTIENEPIISKTLKPFLEDKDCEHIIVVISEIEKADFEKVIHNDKVIYCIGGVTRQDSVYNGLTKVSNDYVMIHDGARPYVSLSLLEDIKQVLQIEDACLLMVPSVDTIKIVKESYVVSTPLREDCYLAQTPQAFKTDTIMNCHKLAKQNHFIGSDDAQLVEQFSETKIKVVMGDYANKKITTQEDL